LDAIRFVGDAPQRRRISLADGPTGKTIANIGQRQAAAVRVKQDLISCLTRCSERQRRTIARLAVE